MSKRANASYNGRLTNYAFGLAQDLGSSLAEFIAPSVATGVSAGQFKKYDTKNAFQTYDTARALGGGATRIKMESTDPFYNCLPQALEIAVDDAERDSAGDTPGAQAALDESKVSTLVSSSTISHENKVFAKIAAAVAAVGSRGVWSSADNDPVKELDEQIQAIAIATGLMPNRIAFGLGAWQVFRNHPKTIARQPGAALIGLTTGQAAQMLLNPGMEIRVGVLSKDTTKFGAAKAATNIVGAEVYVFYGSNSPTIYDPSFCKTFMTRRGGVDAVRTYREESARSDIHAVDWSEDIQVISTECVKRLTIT
jgi:hypothetical protein